MQLIKDNKSLAQAIASLENAKKSQKNLLKEHFVYTIDSLNPINVVKEKFLETFNSNDLKGNFFSGLLSIGSGLVANNLIVGNSLNPIRKIVANLVQNQLSSLNPDTDYLKENGISLLKGTLQKLKIN
jgi:hypothetical protein